MSKIIGIDLGTTNSCVSVFEGGKPTIIVNEEGKRTTPSVVSIKNGERKVGDPARRQAVTNPKNTVYEVKRLIGNTYAECSKEIDRVSYDVTNENGYPRIKVEGKLYSPEEISATILQKMKKAAEDYIGEKVDKCVITCPAYFNDSQRKATKDAAEVAGMQCLRVINEPTAAALAYGVDKSDKDMKVAVFDFGGGTHDISILEFGGGVFEVLASDGDTHLGGSDIDERIMDWVCDEFKNDEGADLKKDPMAMQRIKDAAEKAKIELSNTSSSEINLPYITAVDGTPKHLVKTLTRAKFESLITDIVKRTIDPCKAALDAAGLKTSDIDEVILVGGSTRIPAIQKAVAEFFGKEPSHAVNPDEAVSLGASIQAAILNKEEGVGDIVLLDVTPLNLGIETMGNVLTTIVEANTTIPCKKTMTFSNAADMQPNASIVIYSGNRPMAYQNKMLGQFNIELTPSPKGMNQIEVAFDIDANGILTVSAVDKALNKPNRITIESSSNLSKDDVERMKAEAEMNAEADKKLKEEADKVNDADNFAFQVEKSMNDMKDKVTEEDRNKLQPIVDKLKEAAKDKNMDDIEKYRKELQDAWTPVVQKMYAQPGNTTSNPFEGMNFEQAQKAPDDFNDTDFEEVK